MLLMRGAGLSCRMVFDPDETEIVAGFEADRPAHSMTVRLSNSCELQWDDNVLLGVLFPTDARERHSRFADASEEETNLWAPEIGQVWAFRAEVSQPWHILRVERIFDEYEGAARRRLLVAGAQQPDGSSETLPQESFFDPQLARLLS